MRKRGGSKQKGRTPRSRPESAPIAAPPPEDTLPAPVAVPPPEDRQLARVETALAQVHRAEGALARARTPEAAAQVRAGADALLGLFRSLRAGTAAVNRAMRLKLECERKLGRMLAAMEKDPGGRPGENPSQHGSGFWRTLHQLGINHNQSSRWQKIAGIPEGALEALFRVAGREDVLVTAQAVLRLARCACLIEPNAEAFEEQAERLLLGARAPARTATWRSGGPPKMTRTYAAVAAAVQSRPPGEEAEKLLSTFLEGLRRGLADPGEVRFRAYIPAYVPCLPWAVRGIYATIGGHRYECSVRIEDDWRRTASIWFEPVDGRGGSDPADDLE